MVLNRLPTIHHSNFDLFFVDKFGETLVLLVDLEGELPSVAHDKHGVWLRTFIELVQSCQHEHSGLSHS